jgi:hypothetical protein
MLQGRYLEIKSGEYKWLNQSYSIFNGRSKDHTREFWWENLLESDHLEDQMNIGR